MEKNKEMEEKGKTGKMKICSVEGCDKKPVAKGLCYTHYGRMLRTGSTELKNRSVCKFCGGEVHHKQMCEHHYNLWLEARVCNIEGCEKRTSAKGLCSYHYSKSRKKSEVLNDDAKKYYELLVEEIKKLDEGKCFGIPMIFGSEWAVISNDIKNSLTKTYNKNVKAGLFPDVSIERKESGKTLYIKKPKKEKPCKDRQGIFDFISKM